MFPDKSVHLEGAVVTLRPISEDDAKALFAIAEGHNIWQWYPDEIPSEVAMQQVVHQAIEDRAAGKALPFTICDTKTGEVIGSSRYFNVSPPDRRLEVGYTWIGPRWQGTRVNVEAKYLMFQYAFEKLACERVELKTDSRNLQSQRAMEKLGLVREGVLRSHMRTHTGYMRDSVYFSVIRQEWPEMQKRLRERLQR